MGIDIVNNKNKNCIFNGTYVGRDYVIIQKNRERDYVVTKNVNIMPVSYFIGRDRELRELRWYIEVKHKPILITGMGGIG